MKVLLSLVPPPTDEIRHRESHPACWQQSRMLCERHLHGEIINTQECLISDMSSEPHTTHTTYYCSIQHMGRAGYISVPDRRARLLCPELISPCSKWSEPYWSNVFEVFWGLEASGCQHRFTYWVVETVGEESGIHAEKRLPGSTVRENIK